MRFRHAPFFAVPPTVILWLITALSAQQPADSTLGRQSVDPNFDTKVANPACVTKHPRVLIDEAHFNVHTAGGEYKPFATLIANDGYEVIPNTKPFDAASLAGADILVIANARGAPRPSELPAFTEAECDAVRDWVRAGGNLLLVTDHYPIGHGSENLARRFEVGMSKGTTSDAAHAAPGAGGPSALLYSRENKLLGDHAITRGRNESEHVNKVITFTGQSLKGPEGSVSFLNLADTATDRLPSGAGTRGQGQGQRAKGAAANEPQVSAAGRSQGLALVFGAGRVVVLGEAGDLSAQLAGPQKRPMGMNYPGINNRQMALNIVHWLSRLVD
jgi:hypothetical protein